MATANEKAINSRQKMVDLFSPDEIEITIDSDGSKIWINTENGCMFRAYGVKKLIVVDNRPADRSTDS